MKDLDREHLMGFFDRFQDENEPEKNVFALYEAYDLLSEIALPLVKLVSGLSAYLLDAIKNDPEVLRMESSQLRILLCVNVMDKINGIFPHDLGSGQEFIDVMSDPFIGVMSDPLIMLLLRAVESFALCEESVKSKG